MRRSTDHILSSNAGTLPRPDGLQQLFEAGPDGEPSYVAALPAAIDEVVHKQIEIGIDVVNDGEFSKRGGFMGYIRSRMTGIEQLPVPSGDVERHGTIFDRDIEQYPAFYGGYLRGEWGLNPSDRRAAAAPGPNPFYCTGPLTYVGADSVTADIDRLLGAIGTADVEPYLPVVSPGNIEHWLRNRYYADTESFLFATADMLHEEYKLIADAGVILQIDNPDLPGGWQMNPAMDYAEYRKYAELRVEALNHALRDIPEELVRVHMCWGSACGPHTNDIPLREIIELIFKVKAECYSIEAANAQHEHEWQLWEEVRFPDGKSLMPGVVSHHTDHVEHPELVAWRIKLYANLIGRENVIAGTDCGMARAQPAEICWAKLGAMTQGTRLATRELWKS